MKRYIQHDIIYDKKQCKHKNNIVNFIMAYIFIKKLKKSEKIYFIMYINIYNYIIYIKYEEEKDLRLSVLIKGDLNFIYNVLIF